MNTWDATITVGGQDYNYPAGPFLPDHMVREVKPGVYLNFRGNAMRDVHKPADVALVTHLGPHRFRLRENGKVIVDTDMPNHWWNTHYSVRTAELVVKKTPKQLFDGDFLPSYGPTGNNTDLDTRYYKNFTGPFSTAWVTKYMPTTGERPDIGMITDAFGIYLLTGNPGPMLAAGFACGSFPLHWHDGNTGLPPDITYYPGINSYDQEDRQGAPLGGRTWYVICGPKASNGYWEMGNDCTPDLAHFCDMSYGPTIVYEDPIFLLDLQRSAIFCLGKNAEIFNAVGQRVQGGQYRGIAHGLGMAIKARKATIDAEEKGYFIPGFHLPSSHFDAILKPSCDYYMAATNDLIGQRFSIGPAMYSTAGFWQHNYLSMDILLAALTKAPGWKDYAIFCVKNTVARFSGKSGWPPAWSSYYVDLHKNDGTLHADWGALFDGFYQAEMENVATAAAQGHDYTPGISTADYNKLKADPMNGGKLLGTGEYAMTDMAILTFADDLDKRGVLSVRQDIPYFNEALANCKVLFKSLGSCNPRVSLAANPNPPPVVTPPVTPPTNPPVTPPTNPPPATGGTMVTVVQGKGYRFAPKITAPPGAIHYGVKPGTWKLTEVEQAKLVVAEDQQSAVLTANVDTTAENLTVSCDVFVDAAKTKTLTISMVVADVLVEATAGDFTVQPITG